MKKLSLGYPTRFAEVKWSSPYLHITVHPDSTSAIARVGQTGAGPGQDRARRIQEMVANFPRHFQTAEIVWVKGHIGIPGNGRADALAGMAAEKAAWSPTTSPAHLKLRVSERFRGKRKNGTVTPDTTVQRKSRPHLLRSRAWMKPETRLPGQPPKSGLGIGARLSS